MRAQKTTKNREPEKQDEMKRWTRDQISAELLFSSHDLAHDGYSRNSATSWPEIPGSFPAPKYGSEQVRCGKTLNKKQQAI
jgi:hypothetical protein